MKCKEKHVDALNNQYLGISHTSWISWIEKRRKMVSYEQKWGQSIKRFLKKKRSCSKLRQLTLKIKLSHQTYKMKILKVSNK